MAETPLLEEQRENWGTRAGFVLAAIGSAVGLGNLWGFPYKVYSYGGGAFLLPYLLAMLFVGIPLLILEFSLGHLTQRAAPDAYRGINRKTEPVGWWGILLGFVIITYYPVILAWCGNYLAFCVESIATGEALPWAGLGKEGVDKAGNFFKYSYLNRWQEGSGQANWEPGSLVESIVVSLVIVWVLMYLCIFRGVKLVGKVVLWTVPLPWIMLLILTVRGLTLPGANQGLNFFLAPNWSGLSNPETWRWAFGQMFFSMSLAFGVMITYASFLHRKSDINNNSSIIGLADIATSFMAGIAVFATLGAMAHATQEAARVAGDPNQALGVADVVDGGPGLAFVAFPYALAQLPHAAWFGLVFFLALLTLGIDSAFSITESVLTALVDKTGWKRGKVLIGLTLVGLAAGLLYATRGGLFWLGAMDAFINSTWGGITLLGLLEFVVIGWGYRLGRLREHANERSDWKLGIWWEWLVRYVAPLALSVLFSWSVMIEVLKGKLVFLGPDGQISDPPLLAGLITAVVAPVLAVVLSIIRSPGANAHAQHVGQPRIGRRSGALASLLALASLGGVVALGIVTVSEIGVGIQGKASLDTVVLGPIKLPILCLWVLAPAAAGLTALLLGARAVHKGEEVSNRPSGLARLGAGVGLLGLGAGVGVALSTAQAWAMGAEPAPVAHEQASELTGESMITMVVVLALLVVGLGWCFYRAIQAAGDEEIEPQLSEE